MRIELPINNVAPWNGASSSLPPGEDYIFEITATKLEGSSQKGTPQMRIDVVVMNDGEMQGKKGVFWYILTAPAAGRLRSLTDACGVQWDGTGCVDSDHYVGRRFLADVINDPYKKVNPNTGEETVLDRSKIQNERSLQQVQAQPQAQQFQAPQPQQPAAQYAAPQPQAAPQGPTPFPRPATQGQNNQGFQPRR